ncbi:GlxA family transcriptional regulator [Castellaniella sp.]|uniref:GlxA family transcriptional regulator n=1 Tax=Castellaniella sp. TaxID=1955812 RepID=UPI0025C523D2|nr:helix-turn-helix domain-containing protein [Castellaniella sp.]
MLLPQFTMAAFAAFMDLLGVLGADDETSGHCAWEVVADTLIPVRSASGIQVVPTDLLGNPLRFDELIVVGGPLAPPDAYPRELSIWLRQAARGGRYLAGLCNGVFALATAGVLAGHRVCVASAHYRDFAQRFPSFSPEQVVVDRQSVSDRRCMTCVGGGAVTEIAVRILCRHLPEADVQRALRRLQLEPAESSQQSQPPPADLPPGCPAAVQRAALLIEQYAGHALTLPALADRVGMSPRQLQRLFGRHLQMTPQAYARRVRLRLAEWMLAHTGKSIAMIASDCGFADAAHMGRTFRTAFGVAPGLWRRRSVGVKNTV